MRRKRWESILTQFSYDHRKMNSQFSKVRKSAGELGRILDNMPPKPHDHKEKEHEEHEK